jgi:hypothetical protein
LSRCARFRNRVLGSVATEVGAAEGGVALDEQPASNKAADAATVSVFAFIDPPTR